MTITKTANGFSYRIVPSGIERPDYPFKIERQEPGSTDWKFLRYCASEARAKQVVQDIDALAREILKVPEGRRAKR